MNTVSQLRSSQVDPDECSPGCERATYIKIVAMACFKLTKAPGRPQYWLTVTKERNLVVGWISGLCSGVCVPERMEYGMIDDSERLAVLRCHIQNKEAMETYGMKFAATLKLEGLKQEKI